MSINGRIEKRPLIIKLLLIFAILAAMVVVGCVSNSPKDTKDSIVGKWAHQEQKYTAYYEFSKDGTMTMTENTGSFSLPGKYEFIDDTHLRVDLGAPLVYEIISISGDKMVLKSPLGNIDTYTRN